MWEPIAIGLAGFFWCLYCLIVLDRAKVEEETLETLKALEAMLRTGKKR